MELNKENIKVVILKMCKLFKCAIEINDLFCLSLEDFKIKYEKNNISDEFVKYEDLFCEVVTDLIRDDYVYSIHIQKFEKNGPDTEPIIWISEKGIRYLEIDNDYKEILKDIKPNQKNNIDVSLN